MGACRYSFVVIFGVATMPLGCATQKESHTSRTGVEQLLCSSAIDQSLDKVDYAKLHRRRVFLETKYLDCVDKNYVIVSLHHRLMRAGSKIVEKADEAELVLEVGSGAVGTDGQEIFIGIPEIPLPPPSPVAIPRLAFFTRSKMNGTAKLLVVVYDAKTKEPVINNGPALARSDQNTWNILGGGPVQTGSVPTEIATAEKDRDILSIQGVTHMATGVIAPQRKDQPSEIRTVDYQKEE